MKARDVMVSPVITAKSSATVQEVAKILLDRRISAVPFIDDHGKLVGMVSEGDLMHRAEAGTERKHSWWLRGFIGDETLAADYIKAHACKIKDVMTRDVISASPDSPLYENAKFSVLFPVSREFRNGDAFDCECVRLLVRLETSH